MLNRLVQLLTKMTIKENFCSSDGTPVLVMDKQVFDSQHEVKQVAEHILADGWMRLPCNVGDTVYLADEYYHCEAEIEQIVIDENGISFEYVQYDRGVDTVEVWDDGQFSIEDIGTKVYLTLEDKEKAEPDLIKMEAE